MIQARQSGGTNRDVTRGLNSVRTIAQDDLDTAREEAKRRAPPVNLIRPGTAPVDSSLWNAAPLSLWDDLRLFTSPVSS